MASEATPFVRSFVRSFVCSIPLSTTSLATEQSRAARARTHLDNEQPPALRGGGVVAEGQAGGVRVVGRAEPRDAPLVAHERDAPRARRRDVVRRARDPHAREREYLFASGVRRPRTAARARGRQVRRRRARGGSPRPAPLASRGRNDRGNRRVRAARSVGRRRSRRVAGVDRSSARARWRGGAPTREIRSRVRATEVWRRWKGGDGFTATASELVGCAILL